MAQNVKFIRGETAKINGASVTDGQLLYNTTTGQHYIDNESTRVEVGKPVVNTMAEVSAITEPNISCGTLAVKELNSITTGSGVRGELYTGGEFFLKKQFNHAVASCTLHKLESTIAPFEVVYTLSEDYLPVSYLHIPCVLRNTVTNEVELGLAMISTDGAVTTRSNSPSTGMNQILFTVSYIVA